MAGNLSLELCRISREVGAVGTDRGNGTKAGWTEVKGVGCLRGDGYSKEVLVVKPEVTCRDEVCVPVPPFRVITGGSWVASWGG